MNGTSDIQLEITQYGQQILCDNLIELQVDNEPDLYVWCVQRGSMGSRGY